MSQEINGQEIIDHFFLFVYTRSAFEPTCRP